MAGYPPPYPPPPAGGDWRYQRRVMREQARAQRDLIRAQRDTYRLQLRAARRGSIVGPLLVITIGIVLLMVQTGRLDGHRLGFWYGHWWPAIFVSAGVVLLLEWLFDNLLHRDSQRPYVRRSLSGGVVFLLFLLAIVGIGTSTFHHGPSQFFGHAFNMNEDDIDQFLGDKHETDQVLEQTFPAGASLNITDPRGDVTVTGTSDDGQMHISAHKSVYTRSDAEAARRAQQLAPQVAASGGVVSVDVVGMDGAHVDLAITVPGTVPVTVNANHGDVKLASLKAPVTVISNHGGVEVSAITGGVNAHVNHGGSSFSAHSVSGPVSVEGHASDLTISDVTGNVTLRGEFFGTTHLERISSAISFHTSRTDFDLARLDGEVEISSDDLSADKGIGPVKITSHNRNIRLDRIAGDIVVTNRNGSVDLTSAPPMGNVTLQNRNGTVNFTAPDGAGFTVQAQTTNGNLENEFSLPIRDNDSRKTLNGTIGRGGPLVRIDTSQGDISLRRASIAPLAPSPPPPPAISIVGPDGTPAFPELHGSIIYIGPDGSRYTRTADGTRSYIGHDGTRITVEPDGTAVGIGPGGRVLSDSDIADRMRQSEEAARTASPHQNSPAMIH